MSFKFCKLIICILMGIAFQTQAYCEEIRLGYTKDSTSIVTTTLVKAVLVEKLGQSVKMIPYTPQVLWQAVATKKVDAIVSAWLPQSHGALFKQYKSKVEVLKPVTLGIKMGVVTPTYVTIDNLDQFSGKASRFKNIIYCIKDHIGSIEMTKRTIAAYSLKNIKLVEMTEQELITKLEACVDKLEWIALGAWTPHIIFSQWNLKYLEDKKGVFSNDEQVVAIANTDLSKNYRDTHALLKKFYCSSKELQEIMRTIIKRNKSPYGAAKDYILNNPDQVKKWIQNVEKGHQKRRYHLN